MEEMITMAIELHVGFILLALLLAAYIYFVVGRFCSVRYAQKYEKIYPWYLMSLVIIGFTGLVVMAVEKFAFHWSFIWMIFIFFVMIFTSIKVYKFFRDTHRLDEDSLILFIGFAKKKYLFDIFLMLTTGVVLYAVSI